MALFRVANERAQFDAAGNDARDQYGAGIRFTQEGNARVTTSAGTFYNQGIPMSGTGQVAIVDATAGLPSGTIYHNGLPMSDDKVCVSKNATAVVSNGLPFDSAGALAADINFDLNFIGTDTLNSSVTFTRASTGTFFNSAGVLTSAAINEARFDYNPATLAARGLLIEEQRTNSIRNNTMQGAVAGTPGTLPTNWAGATTVSGLTREIVGTGTENGITYVDIRYFGTTTGALSNSGLVSLDAINQIAASLGQAWTHAVYLKVAAGSMSGVTSFNVRISETDGATVLSNGNTATVPTTAALATQRYSHTRTTVSAGITNVQPSISITAPISSAIDITLRIGLPQLEQGAFATSVIPTTTTALTRSADVASVNTLSPWYNATEGTLFAEWTAQAFTHRPATFNDGTQNNAIALVALATNIGSNVYVSNVFQGTAGVSGTFTTGTTYKQATAYKLNDTQDFANGVAATTDTTISIPTVTQLLLGAGRNGMASTPGNGWLRRFTYYPRRLSAAEGQAITA